MYSVGDIMAQKIGEVQSRLPYGINIGSSTYTSNVQDNRVENNFINDSLNTEYSNEKNLDFDDILQDILETHRVNPTRYSSIYMPANTEANYDSHIPEVTESICQSLYNSYMPTIAPMYNSYVSDSAKISNTNYDSIIECISNRYSVPSNLIKSVIMAESGFNPDAVSHAGAMGLMQLMPSTARRLNISNPFDPTENIDGGTRYLKGQIDKFGGNIDLALAAYNWGPNNISKNNITDLSDPRQFAKLPTETQNYIKRIRSYL